MTRASLIGAPLPRHDALGKVTGARDYPGDLVRAGMLHAKVVFAQRAHARLLKVDTAAALAYPGIVAVFTAADVPYNAFGLIDQDQPVLCDTKVRFHGDKVALVVADSAAAAARGAALVRVEYADLPAVISAAAALADGAPLVHDARDSNLLSYIPIRKGDVAAGFAAADVVLEETFTTSWQEHAYLQPEAGIAFIDDQDRVVVETAGQWLHEDRKQIAAMLRLPEERVVIRYAAIGGAFGGREDLSLQHLLALAAWKLRQPVAMVWSREESIIAHHKRHPVTIHAKWGATRAGKLTAVETTAHLDGGAYASTTVEVAKVVALFATGCYEVPNVASTAYGVYTNNVPSGAFRGFGAPQAQFAAEGMMTRLAHALDLDPLEFRLLNIYREGGIEPTQQVLPPGVSAEPVLRRCIEEAQTRWGNHASSEHAPTDSEILDPHESFTVSGIDGLSPEKTSVLFSAGFQPRVTEPGDRMPSRGFDSGSTPGMRTSVAQDPGAGNPGRHDPGAGGLAPHQSPGTTSAYLRRGIGFAAGMKNLGYSFGFPEKSTATVELTGRGEVERAVVRVGAADVGQGTHLALRQIAAEVLGLAPAQVTMITDDSEQAPNAGSASASRLTLMAGRAVFDAATAALSQYVGSDEQRVAATVEFRPKPTTPLHPETGVGYPNYCYGYAAQAVDVEVNTLTGQVRILRIISVHDVGKAINPQQIEGQIEGCLAQAIGYVLMEDLRTTDGRILTPHFSTYLLPTALDVPPEITPIILELADPHGPFGARGVAELPLVPFLPAVANAIHDAVGVWLTAQPFTPERVLRALNAAGGDAGEPLRTLTRKEN